jgi:hypothetical protein
MTYPDPTMVTIAVSASGKGDTYHLTDDCDALIGSKTREIAKHKIPHAELCARCNPDVDIQTKRNDQNWSGQEFLHEFDATDVARGKLADAISEECE